MIRLILQCILLLLLTVQITPPVMAEEAPLTLLQDPVNKTTNASPQQMQQLGQPAQMGGAAGDQMALYDIYGVVPTKAPIPYLYIALGVLLLFALAALIYWLYKRKKKTAIVPLIPAWEKALMDLKDARSLFGKAEGRDYMSRASQILRRYVEERFAIKSTRQTTREFLGSLKHAKNSEINSYKLELQHCLEQADMAKFARKSVDEENLVVMEHAVTTFVHATRPPVDVEAKK